MMTREQKKLDALEDAGDIDKDGKRKLLERSLIRWSFLNATLALGILATMAIPMPTIWMMMGIPMEIRFGNSQTFPMCGFSNNDWVSALLQIKSYIPLAELGPSHTHWGMKTLEGLPVVTDIARQHAAYTESGAFGSYLLNLYGKEKIKEFNRLSKTNKRPWMKIFGLKLNELEKNWIR